MTERIPRGVPIHNWVDRLVHEAQERGEFDNLPGAGKPLKGLDRPLHEDWWVHQKIAEDEVPGHVLLPPALQLRREVAALPDLVADLPDEASVRTRVREVNARVAEWIRAPKGPVFPVAPARADDVVAGWRAARDAKAPAAEPEPEPPPPSDAPQRKRRRRRWWPW